MISCSKSNSEQIDELMLPYSGDNPGAAVMVIKDGSIVLEKGYGLANLETKEKVTPATNFRLASVTKQFTAMSILMLIEKGKLRDTRNSCQFTAYRLAVSGKIMGTSMLLYLYFPIKLNRTSFSISSLASMLKVRFL